MNIFSGKGISNLLIPPAIGVGLAVFKTAYFDGVPIESSMMMVEIGTTAVAFVITDIVGDMFLGLAEQHDDGSFGKKFEAILIEPPMHGAVYSLGKELFTPSGYYKGGFLETMVEGVFMYSSARFFSEPFLSMFD